MGDQEVRQDKTVVCGCGTRFNFSVEGQIFFAEQGWNDPKRCYDCRAKKKQQT